MNKNDFLSIIEDFMKLNNMSATAFGLKAAKEPNFVFDLRKGREAREDKKNRVLLFMKEYKGADE